MGKIFNALKKSGQNSTPDFISAGRLPEINQKSPPRAPTTEKKSPPPTGPEKTPRLFDKIAMAPDLVCYFKPRSHEADKITTIGTKILFPDQGPPPHAVMVTSAFPGEGKTFIAANLAISIAQGGQDYVLLMDCDIGRCSLQTRFGFGPVSGLAEYLAGQPPRSALFLKTAVPGLTILPGGMHAPHALELLSSRKMANLMDEVTTRYPDRHVVIDAPPLLTAEANALARQVDGVVIVVKYGQTPRRAVADMIENLGREKIIGIVLNGVETDAINAYGYLKKYRGYYH